MGPHFDGAATRIGRKRLPQGYVAVLDDDQHLADVIGELHAYALAGAGRNPPPLGVVFRQVSEGDRDGIGHRLVAHFGAADLLEKAATFGVDEGYHYVFDSRGIAHAWNRHGDPAADERHGQVPITLADLVSVPRVVRPRHIVEFREVRGTPRIVYEAPTAAGALVVVLEVQRNRKWLAVKTIYNRQ